MNITVEDILNIVERCKNLPYNERQNIIAEMLEELEEND